jgi:hypothetical protein
MAKTTFKFDPVEMARKTADAYSADSFRSWPACAKLLAERGYTAEQAEAILRSKWTRWCRESSPSSAKELAAYLDKNADRECNIENVNRLVAGTL